MEKYSAEWGIVIAFGTWYEFECGTESGTEFGTESGTESQIQSQINFECETESETGTNFCVALKTCFLSESQFSGLLCCLKHKNKILQSGLSWS